MADNTVLNPGTSGDTIRDLARQSGTVKTQVVQLDLGGPTANAEVLITAGQQTMAASVPVVIASNQTALPTKVQDGAGTAITSIADGAGGVGLMMAMGATNYVSSTNNSTTTQLAASATFTGVIETAFNEPAASILLVCDQPGILTINQYITSAAGTQCVSTAFTTAATTAGNCYARSFTINGNYVNFTFKNTGASTTTTLNLNVAYGTIPAATQLLNTPMALNEVNGSTFSLGQQVMTASLPVVIASNQTALPVTQATITKGTQGATGVTTQDLKDSGRVSKMFTISALAAAATTEALATYTISSGLGTTTTGSTYTVTTGKTLRIQQIIVCARNSTGTTASPATVRIRAATSGTITTSSPLQAVVVAGTPASAQETFGLFSIPDGFELPSASTMGITTQQSNWVTASVVCTFDVTVIGYEY